MQLRQYLEKKKLNTRKFCLENDLNETFMHRFLNKKIERLDLLNAAKIVEGTKGKVTYRDLISYMSDAREGR